MRLGTINMRQGRERPVILHTIWTQSCTSSLCSTRVTLESLITGSILIGLKGTLSRLKYNI